MQGPSHLGLAVRAGLFLSLAVGLAGCVTTIERPSLAGSAPPTYVQGLAYVTGARNNIDKKLKAQDQLESATKIGVGVGVAGAGINSVFKGNNESILGFLTLGALSYGANQANDPKTLGPLYTAALGNLRCIRSAGAQAHDGLAGRSLLLAAHQQRITALAQALRADLAQVPNQQNPASYDHLVVTAKAGLAATDVVLAQMQASLSETPIAEAMIASTDETLDVTNQELRESSPSIDAIANGGAIFTSFMTQGAKFKESAASAAGLFTKVQGASHTDLLNEALVTHQNALEAELKAVAELVVPTSITQIAACRTLFAATAPLALLVSSPLDLNAGETLSLNTVSSVRVYPEWIQSEPTDVTWRFEDALKLTAKADAVTKTYSLRLRDGPGHASDTIVVNVHAKAAAPPVAPDPKDPKDPKDPAAGPPPPPMDH